MTGVEEELAELDKLITEELEELDDIKELELE